MPREQRDNYLLKIRNISDKMATSAEPAQAQIVNNIVFHMSYLQTVPEFDGEPYKLAEYIRAAEILIAQFGHTPDRFFQQVLLSSLRTKLVGRACIVTSGREINSWADLKFILQQTFADQRDEDSLLRDLMLLKQQNESPQNYYEKCQTVRGLLFSRLSLTEDNVTIRIVKQSMYDSLTLKAFLTGLKEPMGSIIRSRAPTSIDNALSYIISEENVFYARGQPNNLAKKPAFQQQRPSHFNKPSYQVPQVQYRQPTLWPMAANNNFFQQRPIQRPQFAPRPPPGPTFQQNFPQRNVWQNPPQRNFPRPTPMDTSSKQTRQYSKIQQPQQPPRFQQTQQPSRIQQSQQPRNFISEELFYQDDVEADTEYVEEQAEYYDESCNDDYNEDDTYEQDFPPGPYSTPKT